MSVPSNWTSSKICLDILVNTCQYYSVKMWCNTQSVDDDIKLTYEAALRKAREHEAAVREYIPLVEENPTTDNCIPTEKKTSCHG